MLYGVKILVIKIDVVRYWQDHWNGWHILGFHLITMVEGGSMGANSNIVGHTIRWDWNRKSLSNRLCPNVFRTFNGKKLQEKINEKKTWAKLYND